MATAKPIGHDVPERGYPGQQLATEDEWLTYDELAKLIKVSKRTLWRWVALEKIPHHRISGWYVRFSRQEVEAWLRNGRRRK